MKISVFTPTHDLTYLARAYESLCAQTHEDWEWVVLLNGESKYKQLPFDTCSRVHVWTTDTGPVVGTLKREAAGYCTGEWIVELDHDDELLPDCLAEIAKSIADFVYSDNIRIGSELFSPVYGWEHIQAEEPYVVTPEPYPSNLSRIWYAPDHVRAWRRDFYQRIGGHADMPVCDDHDLVCRSYLAGTVEHIAKPLYKYNVHGNNTWLKNQDLIQVMMWQIHDKYFIQMQEKYCRQHGLRMVDLGGAINPAPGYESYDLRNADIIGDLNQRWKLADSSVGLLRAHDIVEHLQNPVHTMNEAYRVLTHGGVLDILVPSTDGRGAWCDPTHVSFWNLRSFRYYTERNMHVYLEPALNVRFQVVKLSDVTMWDNIPYVQAQLLAIKDGPRYHGELLI